MITTLRPDTIPSTKPIKVVPLKGTQKVLALAYAEGVEMPLVIAQSMINGLYLPHYDAVGANANTFVRGLSSRVTVHIPSTHNIWAAVVDLSEQKKMRSGPMQCISFEHALHILDDNISIAKSGAGNPLDLIDGKYPHPDFADSLKIYLREQIEIYQDQQACDKDKQLSLPVPIPAAPRIHSRERLDELLHARDAKMMAIRDINNKLHHAQEAERAAQQAVAAQQKALAVLECELEEIKKMLQGGEP